MNDADTFDDELQSIMDKHMSKFDTFLPKKKVQNTPELSNHHLRLESPGDHKQEELQRAEINNYKLRLPATLVAKPQLNYVADDLKSNSKFLQKKRIDYEIFKADDSIDLLIVGTDACGKSTLIKSMTEDEKFFMTAGTKVNDIIRMDVDGFQIMARELSYAFLPSWERYLSDAKTLIVACYS